MTKSIQLNQKEFHKFIKGVERIEKHWFYRKRWQLWSYCLYLVSKYCFKRDSKKILTEYSKAVVVGKLKKVPLYIKLAAWGAGENLYEVYYKGKYYRAFNTDELKFSDTILIDEDVQIETTPSRPFVV